LAPRVPHVAIPIDRDVNLRILLESLLDRDPSNRPSADEALAAEFFYDAPEDVGSLRSDAALDAFRQHVHLLKNKARGFAVRWKIDPDNLVSSTCAAFTSLNSSTNARLLKVTFEGEKGVDAGGLTTSLYRRFFSQMLEPVSELFESRGGGTYLPLSSANCRSLQSVGLAIARAIYDERVVELRLGSAVFKHLYSTEVDMNDLESFDEQQSLHLKQLLRCPNVQAMGLSFAYCGGSETLPVTDFNKEEFVRQKVHHELIVSRSTQLEAIKQGFWSLSVIQKPLMTLSWRDVIVLLCGDTFVSAEMLLDVLVFEGFSSDSCVPTHLRTVIEGMGPGMISLSRSLRICDWAQNSCACRRFETVPLFCNRATRHSFRWIAESARACTCRQDHSALRQEVFSFFLSSVLAHPQVKDGGGLASNIQRLLLSHQRA
jgi:hypothetical protein